MAITDSTLKCTETISLLKSGYQAILTLVLRKSKGNEPHCIEEAKETR